MAIKVLTAYIPNISGPPSVSGGGKDKFSIFEALGTATRALTSDTSVQFESAAFYGYKSVDGDGIPVDNTADVLIGGLDASGNPLLLNTITPGGQVVINAPGEESLHLSEVWVKAADATDGVAVEIS